MADETRRVRYDYSSVLIHPPEGLTDSVISWGFDHVPSEALFVAPNDPTFGREDDAHVTVIYGIDTDSVRRVVRAVGGFRPFECVLRKMSLFTTNSKFDVLKIEVEGDDLHRLHRLLKRGLDVGEGFPPFAPHLTIAYVRKGAGGGWVGEAAFDGERFTVGEVIFSSRSGAQTAIKLGDK